MLQDNDRNARTKSNKCNDAGFAIFFVISILCNIGLASYGLSKYGKEMFDGSEGSVHFEFKIKAVHAIYVSVVCLVSILYSMLWIFCLSLCAQVLIKASLLAELVLELGLGLYLLSVNPMASIPFFIIAAFRAWWMWAIWRTIPFCTSLFSVALAGFKRFYSPIFIHMLMVVVAAAVLLVDGAAFFASNKLLHFQNGSQTAFFSFGFVQLVFIYWHFAATQTVAFVTSCGVMVQFLNRESVSTLRKFKVSCTSLFGSICFGTLLEAIINALRVIAEQRQRQAERDGNMLQMCVFCCLQCLLRCIGDILEYLNSYVWVYVAKNEAGYIESCKQVWDMFQRCGFLPLVNDYVLAAPMIVGGLLLLAIHVILGVIFAHSVGFVAALVGGILGLLLYSVMTSVLTAYIKTTFVLWAEDQDVFAVNQPEYHAVLSQAASEAGHGTYVPDSNNNL